MNILHLIPGLASASGPTAFCVKLSDQMADGQTHVAILHGDRVGATSCMPKNPRVQLMDFWQSVRQSIQPDIIHVHALWTPFSHAGVRYARQHKVPYVVSAHGMLAPWALKHKWLKKKLAWWLYQRADLKAAALFHVTAECEVKWLRDLGFKQPCVLVPLGSELPILTNAETQRRRDVKTVLFVGRIYPVKGLMNLVRAWAEVKRSSKVLKCESAKVRRPEDGGQRTEDGKESSAFSLQPSAFPQWQLVIAGPDQAGHKAEVVAEAVRLGLRVEDATTNELMNSRTNELLADLIFTGPVYGADKDALHRIADLFVLPSFTENFGAVVTDALSYGIPVITTKGTPWSELLGNSDSSLVHYCKSALVGEVGSRKSEVGGESGDSAISGIGELSTVSRGSELNTVSRGSELSETNAMCEPVQGVTNSLKPNAPNALNQLNALPHAANGRSGWWIDIGVEPLVEVLNEAMSLTDEERHQMGMNGRMLIETKYTWPVIADEMRRAFSWFLEGHAMPECVRSVEQCVTARVH